MNKVLLALLISLVCCNNLRSLSTFDFDSFYNDLVDRHNFLRSKHSASPLTKLDDIAVLAQQTADHCKELGHLEHYGKVYNGSSLGQNLYLVGGGAPTGAGVANHWYEENVNYDYTTGQSKNGKTVGHFTQLVWKSSERIGCAVAKGVWLGFDPSYFVCCNYYPAGNVYGQYVQNVDVPTS